MWLALTTGAALAASDCDEAVSLAAVSDGLESALKAYEVVDLDAFETAMSKVRRDLACVEASVPATVVATLHRLEGLAAFVADKPQRSTVAFAAARALEPAYRFPLAVVPEGNPVLDDYTAIDPNTGKTETAPEPVEGTLRFDGADTPHRPRSFPSLFQHLLRDGSVDHTAYLWPAEPLPAYAFVPPVVAPPPVANPALPVPVPSPRPSKRKPLWIIAGSSAAASAVLYGSALLVHGTYLNPDTPKASLGGLRGANNGLLVASGVTLGGAVGFGIAGVAAGP